LTLKAKRPLSPAYPQELKTLGDHLRKRRLDLGLLQKDVAQRLGVNKDYVYYWETNRYAPSLQMIARIIQFLGYMPWDPSNMTLGERIVTLRSLLGISQKELARQLEVDPTTLSRWELGKGQSMKKHLERLTEVLESFQ
jgi:transcriptional regulator with XRE-family HTH domain